MATEFIHLNRGWNAEPNAPEPEITVIDDTIELTFFLNPWAYDGIEEDDRGKLVFSGCSRYRLGPTNDEGWLRGQCRFSKLAPNWGEFYELTGELLLEKSPDDWLTVSDNAGGRHFLFYFRDNTFECEASDYSFLRID